MTGKTAGPLARWTAQFLHDMAAVGEGLCPVHLTALEPVTMADAPIAGHCEGCRGYWWTDPAGRECGWATDREPDGSFRLPERRLR